MLKDYLPFFARQFGKEIPMLSCIIGDGFLYGSSFQVSAAMDYLLVYNYDVEYLLCDLQCLQGYKKHIINEGENLKIDFALISRLQDVVVAGGYKGLIAFGSGTVNDLCKYVSYKFGISYISIPTALSMNGYASPTASIIAEGIKQSFSAHLPIAVFCDIKLVMCAPQRLTNAGFWDSVAAITADFDWRLSSKIIGKPYNPIPFEVQKFYLQYIIENFHLINANNTTFMINLAITIFAAGFGMWFVGGSQSASGAEHILAHILESKFPDKTQNMLHGEMIYKTLPIVYKMQKDIKQNLKLREHVTFKPIAIKDIIKEFNFSQQTAENIAAKMQNVMTDIDIADINHKININSLMATVVDKQSDTLSNDDIMSVIPISNLARNRFTVLDILNT